MKDNPTQDVINKADEARPNYAEIGETCRKAADIIDNLYKANEARANYVNAGEACRKAYAHWWAVARPQLKVEADYEEWYSDNTAEWIEYEKACEHRDGAYYLMNEANERLWAAKLKAGEADADEIKPGTISFAGPGADRWKEIYEMSPPPAGVQLID